MNQSAVATNHSRTHPITHSLGPELSPAVRHDKLVKKYNQEKYLGLIRF